MYEQVEKPKKKKINKTTKLVSQKKSNGHMGSGIVDNRPITNAQKLLRARTNTNNHPKSDIIQRAITFEKDTLNQDEKKEILKLIKEAKKDWDNEKLFNDIWDTKETSITELLKDVGFQEGEIDKIIKGFKKSLEWDRLYDFGVTADEEEETDLKEPKEVITLPKEEGDKKEKPGNTMIVNHFQECFTEIKKGYVGKNKLLIVGETHSDFDSEGGKIKRSDEESFSKHITGGGVYLEAEFKRTKEEGFASFGDSLILRLEHLIALISHSCKLQMDKNEIDWTHIKDRYQRIVKTLEVMKEYANDNDLEKNKKLIACASEIVNIYDSPNEYEDDDGRLDDIVLQFEKYSDQVGIIKIKNYAEKKGEERSLYMLDTIKEYKDVSAVFKMGLEHFYHIRETVTALNYLIVPGEQWNAAMQGYLDSKK